MTPKHALAGYGHVASGLYMVLGDMNTELSNKATLNKNWYKQKPFNCHSVLLFSMTFYVTMNW